MPRRVNQNGRSSVSMQPPVYHTEKVLCMYDARGHVCTLCSHYVAHVQYTYAAYA